MNDNPEVPSSQNEKDKENIKWFDWHWSPEEPIKIKSVVEVLTFTIIVAICGFLYWRWNVVPIREMEITVEDLSKTRENPQYIKDSISHAYWCDIKCCVPMTRHKEFINKKDTDNIIVTFYQLYSDHINSDFIRLTFLKDSLRNTNENTLHLRADFFSLYSKYNLHAEGEYICSDSVINLNQRLDSLREIISDSLNITTERKDMLYSRTVTIFPYFSGLHKETINKDTFSLISTKCNGKQDIREMFVIVKSSDIGKIGITERASSKIGAFGLYTFNPYIFFRGGTSVETPPLLRLEDISQAYVKLKLNSSTIDSVVLNIDFVGVTEFSAMDPEPDEIGMSNIVFRDPIKIFKIRQNGLLFHARFRELENIQQIRTFTVTAIGSAFVLALVVFVISAYFKIRKKVMRANKKVQFMLWLAACTIGGVLLYAFIYWTMMYFVVESSADASNLLTIPLVLLIILSINKQLRNKCFGYIHKKLSIRTAKPDKPSESPQEEKKDDEPLDENKTDSPDETIPEA